MKFYILDLNNENLMSIHHVKSKKIKYSIENYSVVFSLLKYDVQEQVYKKYPNRK